MSNETKTQKPEGEKTRAPAVVVYGPSGCGKTTLIDLMTKFFETDNVVDGWDWDHAKECPFDKLKAGTLYISNHPFSEADVMHGGLAHGVVVADFYTVLKDLGGARGRTAVAYYTERFMEQMLKDALRMSGPRRGPGGFPLN